jgi:organic radical activating enzyme
VAGLSEAPRSRDAPTAVAGPLWLLAELTYKCLLHSVFCYNPVNYASIRQELSTDEWSDVMRQARNLGAAQLGFSGCEPLLRDDLELLLEEDSKLGYDTNLITSAVGLTESHIARITPTCKRLSGTPMPRKRCRRQCSLFCFAPMPIPWKWANENPDETFRATQNVLAGIELMHMIRKGQIMIEGAAGISFAAQFHALAGHIRASWRAALIPHGIAPRSRQRAKIEI